MRFSIVILFALSCVSAASAERYAGSVDTGQFQLTVESQFGSNFFFTGKPHYEFELSVDRSQNVTFHKFDMSYVGRLEFTGHPGQVYADIELGSSTNPGSIDMNPFPYDEHVFRSAPFAMGNLRIKGDYFNRGFESSFDEIFVQRNPGGQIGLSFADFPNSLQMVGGGLNDQHFSASAAVVQLEPLLQIDTVLVNMIHDAYLDVRLDPLPPLEVHDVVGDSNYDGRFDSGDLVTVFQAGEYEDAIVFNSTWETGDWNGDKEFDSGDLVSAFQAGEYKNDAVAVPEPVSVLMVLGAFAWAARRVTR